MPLDFTDYQLQDLYGTYLYAYETARRSVATGLASTSLARMVVRARGVEDAAYASHDPSPTDSYPKSFKRFVKVLPEWFDGLEKIVWSAVDLRKG